MVFNKVFATSFSNSQNKQEHRPIVQFKCYPLFFCLKTGVVVTRAKPELNMKVLPVNFSTDHKKLLANLKMFMSDGLLAIDRRCDKLINSLNTASDIENSLQKNSMSNSDSLDSLYECR